MEKEKRTTVLTPGDATVGEDTAVSRTMVKFTVNGSDDATVFENTVAEHVLEE